MHSVVYDFFEELIPVRIDIKSRIDGEFLTTCSSSLNIFHLNGVAKDFFLLCDGSNSVERICTALSKEYDVENFVLQNDITPLIRDFQWKNLILLKE